MRTLLLKKVSCVHKLFCYYSLKMDPTVLPIHVDTIEKKPDDVQPELKAVRVLGLWCINPGPQIVQLIYALITFIFVTTLMMWFGFLLFTLINVDSTMKKFPEDIYNDSIREYYNDMFGAMITVMLVFSLTSMVLMALVLNSLRKEPKNPLTLIFLFIRVNKYFMIALTPLLVWLATTNRPIPPLLNCVLYGLFLFTLVLMAVSFIFVHIKKLTSKYRIKYPIEKRVLESVVVESWVEPIANSN